MIFFRCFKIQIFFHVSLSHQRILLFVQLFFAVAVNLPPTLSKSVFDFISDGTDGNRLGNLNWEWIL